MVKVLFVWSQVTIKSDLPAALQVLQDYYIGNFPSTMRIAAASSADTPLAVEIGRAAMNLLEVLPGITLRKVFAKGGLKDLKGIYR